MWHGVGHEVQNIGMVAVRREICWMSGSQATDMTRPGSHGLSGRLC